MTPVIFSPSISMESSGATTHAPFVGTREAEGFPVAMERSRSGNGAHVWMFFSETIPATIARSLATALPTATMDRRPDVGLRSYDRLFPNQDTLPKGGFGSLIALPLQKESRAGGNSVFVDTTLKPYSDQWQYLSTVERIPIARAKDFVKRSRRRGEVVGGRLSMPEAADEEAP